MSDSIHSYTQSQWTDHLFENLAYDQPNGFWEDDYADPYQEQGEPTQSDQYETYNQWADNMRNKMHEKMNASSRQDEQEFNQRKEEKRRKSEQRSKDALLEEKRIEKKLIYTKKKNDLKLFVQKCTMFKKRIDGLNGNRLIIGYQDVPWPLKQCPRKIGLLEGMLTFEKIKDFLTHDSNLDKSFIKDQLLLWHPDKFGRYRKIIHHDEWDQVLILSILVSKALTRIYTDE